MVVNADAGEIPAGAAALVRTSPIAGDAMADTLETPELFDVDVNDLAWVLALIAALPARALAARASLRQLSGVREDKFRSIDENAMLSVPSAADPRIRRCHADSEAGGPIFGLREGR